MSSLSSFLKQCYAVPLRPYQLRTIAGLTRPFVNHWEASTVDGSTPAVPAERVGGVVHLRTGAGKTDIAAAVTMTELLFPFYLARLQGNGDRPSFSPKDFVMLTPTRVLTEQQSKLFVDRLGQPAALELLRYANVGVDILVSTQGAVSPVASLNDCAKTNRVRILVSTPGSYTEIVGSAEPLFRRGVAPNFPMPQHCSTVFFDEVHHCAAGHPFTEVAGAVHTAKLLAIEGGDSVRMGLTATLSYAQKSPEIEKSVRDLFAMLLAPLAERYAATDEELRACGVPEPPKCALVASLAGVAEVQAEVADALSAGTDADVVPMPYSDAIQSTNLVTIRRAIGASSITTVAAPSAGISAALKRRLLAGNPIAAISELSQLGHCEKLDEEVESAPFDGPGGYTYIVTMRFKRPNFAVTGD